MVTKQIVRERQSIDESMLLKGIIAMPVEIQELEHIVDELNAPPPPTVEWTST